MEGKRWEGKGVGSDWGEERGLERGDNGVRRGWEWEMGKEKARGGEKSR